MSGHSPGQGDDPLIEVGVQACRPINVRSTGGNQEFGFAPSNWKRLRAAPSQEMGPAELVPPSGGRAFGTFFGGGIELSSERSWRDIGQGTTDRQVGPAVTVEEGSLRVPYVALRKALGRRPVGPARR